jgi:NAD(P)H-nitrite reductase large subunit
MQGLDKVKRKFTFMSLDDARNLEAAIKPDSNVLVIGAGLIGLKCVEGIIDRVGKITVIDLAPRILPSILDDKGSEIIQKYIESKGVDFILSDSADSFEENGVTLKSGKKLGFDVLVIAVGVRPNTELVADAGGQVKRGITTDIHCKTTLEDVYAAGDCTESFDITTGENRIMAILPNAYMQGETAGANMAGEDVHFDRGFPMNAIGFFGLHVITAGSYDGDAIVYEKETNYKKLIVKDNLLKGYIMIGDVIRAGIYTSLIRDRIPLDTIDFELIKERPQLMAFTKTKRDAIFTIDPAKDGKD